MNLFSFFKRRPKRKESQTTGVISAPGRGRTIWTPTGYDNFAKETYLKNSIAYRAIDEVAKSVASVPWKEFERVGENPKEIQDSEMAEVLKRPNPQESLNALMLKTTAYLVMSGNSFLERISPTTGPNKGKVRELFSLRPDRFKIETDAKGRISKYKYEVQSRSAEWDVDPITGQSEILHLKSFHPLDDWWGAAATESAAREIDTSNAATEWNKSLLDNQGRPGMVFTLIGAAGEEQFDQLERHLRDRAGPSHVGEDLIITGEAGTKAEPYGWSPTDMDFTEGDLSLARKIATAYGVPPMILGIPGESTFANYKEARLAFWETTVFWWLNYIRGELNNWLYAKGINEKRFVSYVLDEVPALSEKRDSMWERAQKSTFLTINEKREMVGKKKVDEGDVILIEASQIPLGTELDINGNTDIEDEPPTEEETEKQLLAEGLDKEIVNELFGY